MSSDSHQAPSTGEDCYTTKLTFAEKSSGAGSRRIAFRLLLGGSLVACIASVYCWYLWGVTAHACVEIYIRQRQESLLLAPDNTKTWQDYFSGLDISSFSALILAFFFTRLAYAGIRNTLWKRHKDGEAYYDHAYDAVLFPEHFELLCIRFGLLGTLLSFLLAAISQMSDPVTRAPSHQPVTLARSLEAIAEESASDDGRPEATSGAETSTSPSSRKTPPNDKLADNMFLLLCASLVSTFVGTLIAYMALPPLNWLNDRATGMHQRGLTDEEATTEEFFRQLDRTSQRLAEFESATTALSGTAAGVIQFQTAAAEASENFSEMAHLLTEATELFEASNKHTEKLTKCMDAFEGQSSRISLQLHDFARELQDPLDRMFKAAGAVQESAIAGSSTYKELRLLAEAMRDPLDKINSSSHITWKLLKEVRDSLSLLASSEEKQTTRIVVVTDLFAGITTILSEFLEKTDSFLKDQRREQSGDRSMHAAIVTMRQQLSEITDQVSELKGTSSQSGSIESKVRERHALSVPAAGMPPLAGPSWSLWHWLFGRLRSPDGNGPMLGDPQFRTSKSRSADKDKSS